MIIKIDISKIALSLILIVLGFSPGHAIAQGSTISDPAIVVLDVNDGAGNNLTYQRANWAINQKQSLLPGTLLNVESSKSDKVFGTFKSLWLLCPNGTIKKVNGATWTKGTEIKGQCALSSSSVIVGMLDGTNLVVVSKSGTDRNIPRVISPRATAVSTIRPTLYWLTSIIPVESYSLILTQNDDDTFWNRPITQTELLSAKLASYTLDVNLLITATYDLDVCVNYKNGGVEKCSNEQEGLSTTFFYRPITGPLMRSIEKAQKTVLPKSSGMLPFIEAVLLSQPNIASEPGYYAEAIAKLERLTQTQADSRLAKSPMTSIVLGWLYERVGLHDDSNEAYQQAKDEAAVGSEAQLLALLGMARTATGNDSSLQYNEALRSAKALLTDMSYQQLRQKICADLRDNCKNLNN